MAHYVKNINPKVLSQCREQMGMSLEHVQKKVKKIASFESGENAPTFNQLDLLEKLYRVPRWVFISDSLPSNYQFKNIPSFRQFAKRKEEAFGDPKEEAFDDPKVRGLIAEVSQLRQLMLDIQEDLEEPFAPFEPPVLPSKLSAKAAADEIRSWCGLDINTSFEEWRKTLEKKGIFIFLTTKYRGWSHIKNRTFRGSSIYHKTLPIIIINDSDAHKALSFTLFHELGHLLRKESALDAWDDSTQQQEKWCDDFSGNILMPKNNFLITASEINNIDNLNDVKHIAKRFNVSLYACLVRLRQLDKIDQGLYEALDTKLNQEYERAREKLKQSANRPVRDRAKEVLRQYGRIYTNTIFQCYYDKDIGLHKLCKFLDLKRVSDVRRLESDLCNLGIRI